MAIGIYGGGYYANGVFKIKNKSLTALSSTNVGDSFDSTEDKANTITVGDIIQGKNSDDKLIKGKIVSIETSNDGKAKFYHVANNQNGKTYKLIATNVQLVDDKGGKNYDPSRVNETFDKDFKYNNLKSIFEIINGQ